MDIPLVCGVSAARSNGFSAKANVNLAKSASVLDRRACFVLFG